MNQTPNYQLNQWEADDRVQRTDFNADNAKIDAALGALAAGKADASAVTVLPVELKRVKLTGTAKKIVFDLTDVDLVKYPRLRVNCPQLYATTGQMGIQVNGITSGYVRQSATSVGGQTSAYYATIGGYGTASASTTDIFPLSGGIAFHSDSLAVSASRISAIWDWTFLRGHPYQEMTSLEVVCEEEEDNYLAGSEVILYGLRA